MPPGPPVEGRHTVRSWTGMGVWPWLALAMLAANLAATWRWFDVDEFVNLQQAMRAGAGRALYVETPAHHPPLYLWMLQLLVRLPGDPLVWARVASAGMTWAVGLMAADVWLRHGRAREARWFLMLWSLNAFVVLVGTRAMNEVPLLFLMAAGVWAAERARAVGGGALLGAAHLARLSAAFFAPAVLLLARARARTLAGAAIVVVALLGAASALQPSFLAGLWEGAVAFHAARPAEPWWERALEVVGWGGLPVAALLAWARPELLDRRSRWTRAAAAALAGGAAMVALRAVHVHYFLPLTLVTTAGLAYALANLRGESSARRLAPWLAVAILVPLGQGLGYVAMTSPQGDLAEADAVAAAIDDHSPASSTILTDAPQFAVRADRDNLDGYFWSLRDAHDRSWFEDAWGRVALVVVSDRGGPDGLGRGFPQGTMDALAGHPCLDVLGHRLYWPEWRGDAPADFRPCP